MAIYHFSMKASSKNAAPHALYISGDGKYESKNDVREVHDLNMPDCSGAEFWQSCQKHERKNANLYKEFEISLPRELDTDQQQELAFQMVDEFIPNQPCTLALHEGTHGDNPHMHLMFSMRANDDLKRDELSQFFKRANKKHPERGGAPKVDEWRGSDFIHAARERVEVLINEALAEAGHDAQVDHRSLAEQGIIERLPLPKISYAAMDIEAKKEGASTGLDKWQKVVEINDKRAQALGSDPRYVARLVSDFKALRTSALEKPKAPTIPTSKGLDLEIQSELAELKYKREMLEATQGQLKTLNPLKWLRAKLKDVPEAQAEFNQAKAEVVQAKASIVRTIKAEYKADLAGWKAQRKVEINRGNSAARELKDLDYKPKDEALISAHEANLDELEAQQRQAERELDQQAEREAQAQREARYNSPEMVAMRQAKLEAKQQAELEDEAYYNRPPSNDMGM